MEPEHIQHLYWRARFGILPKPLKALKKKSRKAVVNALFQNSEAYEALQIDTSDINSILESQRILSDEERKKIQVYTRRN